MNYRSEIDGLRALAVVPVMLFHAEIDWFSGVYVGVDVFFVISGNLITSIIVDRLENKTFSLVDFYERRARRVLPALVLVTIASLLAAWIFMSPAELRHYGKALIGVATFRWWTN